MMFSAIVTICHYTNLSGIYNWNMFLNDNTPLVLNDSV